jgi:hypothetical protein
VNQSKLNVVYVIELEENIPQIQESVFCGDFEES